jgi:hypothetical protein
MVTNRNAGREPRNGFRGGNAFDLSVIFAGMRASWIKQTLHEGAFVGKEEEPFAVGVEAADRVNAGREIKGSERVPARAGLGRELREDAVRFVKCEEHGGSLVAV